MEQLIVVGAGGLGRETVEAVRATQEEGRGWDPVGYLDDDPSLHGEVIDGVPVLGPCAELSNYPRARVVLTPGSPRNFSVKRELVARFGLEPERYATVIHPGATVGRSVQVGVGTVVLAGAVMTTGLRVGAHVTVMPGAVVTHDDVIDDYSTLASGVRLGGRVHIGEGAYLGSGALVREDLSVGSWSLVGMGAVVTCDVPAMQTWVGVPARFLRSMDPPPQHLKAVRS